MDPACNLSIEWTNSVLTLTVAVICVVWAWKQVTLQISDALDKKRLIDDQDEFGRVIRCLAARREASLTRAVDTIRSGEKQRLLEDAECFEDAIRRLHALKGVAPVRLR